MTDLEAAYFAGVLDGDGAIGLRMLKRKRHPEKRYGYARITVANTDARLIGWLLRALGGVVQFRPATGRSRDVYFWHLHGPKAAEAAREALPYLIVKKRRASILLEYVATYRRVGRAGHSLAVKARRNALASELRRLNIRGRNLTAPPADRSVL